MSAPIPGNANEFIERQLDDRLRAIEDLYKADGLSFTGPILWGVETQVRNLIESKRVENPNRTSLVVVLTTTGGYVEIVKRIVDTIRHHYRRVIFIVPNYAFSAGTVLALSGDEIHMDYFSQLGPIDPQIDTGRGRMVPALGYLEQYNRLIQKANDGKITAAEVQLLINGFDQAELYQYEQARDLSISLIKEWLVKYKFKNWRRTKKRNLQVTPAMRRERAEEIATILNKTEKWHAHGCGISMAVLRRDLNLVIDDFRADACVDKKIRDYYNLLDDYMIKRGNRGVLHMVGTYRPYK